MEVNMRDDIVVQTRAYLECSYLLLFAIALARNKVRVDRALALNEFSKWKHSGRIPVYLGDFCLDVLSGRLRINIEPKDVKQIRGVYGQT